MRSPASSASSPKLGQGGSIARGSKGEKCPADVIGNAVHVMRAATGEIEEGRRWKCVGKRCQKKHCVLNATAKERLSALHVVALAKNPSQVFQSATVKNAAELGNAAAIFVVVQAKSIISRHVQRNTTESRCSLVRRTSGYELTSNKALHGTKNIQHTLRYNELSPEPLQIVFGGLASEGIEERGDAL